MRGFCKWFILILAVSFLPLGMTGCKAFKGHKNEEIGNRAQVIRKKNSDSSTMAGFVGGERPSF